jgi:hypothetical protein
VTIAQPKNRYKPRSYPTGQGGAAVYVTSELQRVSSALNDADDTLAATGTQVDTNTSNIAANTTAIAANTSAITALQANQRTRLSANTTYRVATTGNDTTGDGSVAKPWATLAKAWSVISNTLDFAGFTVTIQMADGTYTSGILFTAWVGGGAVVLNGNSSTPANVVVSVTGGHAVASSGALPGTVTLTNFKVQTATTGSGISHAAAGLMVVSTGMVFGACAIVHIAAVNAGSQININANYTINGSAQYHYYAAVSGATITAGSIAVTMSGTLAFSVAFVFAQSGGAVSIVSSTWTGGTITGTRYTVVANGSIFTGTAGTSITYFPGDAAGSVIAGGQYW